jgi:SAM-dependent methyltransferase
MRDNADKKVASNDEAMWAAYHSAVASPVHVLNLLKQTVVCEMFASKILSMSGPVSSTLELGCGTASTLNVISRRTSGRCVGIDRDPEAVAKAKAKYPKLELQVGDIFNLPLPPKSFDLVYSVGLLEHFTRAEQRRLLEIHARFATKYVALMVPADSLLMNSILFVNKKVLKRTGYWADEEVFSPALLRDYFPEYKFDATFDLRFGNLIMWFGYRPDAGDSAEAGATRPSAVVEPTQPQTQRA